MREQLEDLVISVLGNFLKSHRFRLVDRSSDKTGSVTDFVYSSNRCKLRFYDSPRDGEINCLIGALDANDKETRGIGKMKSWFYIRDLLEIGKGMSLKEIQALVGPPTFDPREQLFEISKLLNENLEAACAKLHRGDQVFRPLSG